MWMVERRKEERWEEQRKRGSGTTGSAQEGRGRIERKEGGIGGVDGSTIFKKAADRARLEREGDLILEAEARHEEEKRELKEENRARLEREGDLILEAEARYEEKRREVKKGRRGKFGRKLRTGKGWKGKEMKWWRLSGGLNELRERGTN